MKAAILFIFLLLCYVKCTTNEAAQKNVLQKVKPKEIVKAVNVPQINLVQKIEKKDLIFTNVKDFPRIKDSNKFIKDLVYSLNLELSLDFQSSTIDEITAYKKVKIYGSKKEYFFIEYDYKEGCGAAFPWKQQFILSLDGKLVGNLNCLRYQFIKIFEDQRPFLLTVSATSKGNGGHDILKIVNDTLQTVYENNLEYFLRTYDRHEDENLNEPVELKLKIKDFNKDGVNDICFYGHKIIEAGYSCNISKKDQRYPLKLIFLYDKKTGKFREKENYSLVYKNLE
jgi:hypothetical protein